jgi:hypothetical protein
VPDMQAPFEPPQQYPAPQPPPSQLDVQAPPAQSGVAPPHEMHAVPADPHCIPEVPVRHVVPLQHPPVQTRPPAQPVPHAPEVGSQASPLGQLVEVQWEGASAEASGRGASRLEASWPEAWVSTRPSSEPSRVGWTVTSPPPS